jgi:hypothetical protein
MPRPTVAPLVLSLGIVLLAGGLALGIAFVIVGACVLVIGLGMWIVDLLPGRGHVQEALVEPGKGPAPIAGEPGTVEQLLPGMLGYRVQLPEKVHPISAGVKGGILGGVAIIVPALIYGLVSRQGIWYPANLLAGMVLPGLENMDDSELQRFNLSFLIAAVFIHATMSVVFGLLYGVLLPTLPDIRKPLAWGGLLMPLLWTAVTFLGLKVVNPVLDQKVGWPSFILAQFIFGVAAALVVMRAHRLSPLVAGSLGGIVGGALMPIPAVLWGLATGHGIWYPLNLLAGVVVPNMSEMPLESLKQFHANWLAIGLVIHAVLSVAFGIVYAIALPKLPEIPGPMSWGGLLMPLLWTAATFGLMGVVNPVLQERVDWPWFIVSQFIFGVVASIVVVRSQPIPVPPAGRGPSPAQPSQPA